MSVSYLAHKYCFLMDDRLIRLHVIADLTIALAYLLISLGLFLGVLRLGDQYRQITEFVRGANLDLLGEVIIRWRLLSILFGSFILGCGISHVFKVLVLFHPLYWLQGYWDLLVGIISMATAFVLIALAMKSGDRS